MRIATYSKRELAMLYAPNLSGKSAVNRLVKWISINKPLSDELQKVGYRKTQRVFTCKQVELIFDFLGEP